MIQSTEEIQLDQHYQFIIKLNIYFPLNGLVNGTMWTLKTLVKYQRHDLDQSIVVRLLITSISSQQQSKNYPTSDLEDLLVKPDTRYFASTAIPSCF